MINLIKQKIKNQRIKRETKSKLVDQLIELNKKCQTLRLIMGRKNKSKKSEEEYEYSDLRIRKLISLTLNQLKIQKELKSII
jgi:hypothetical protein|tara:strand:+ start:542 stop:787 length:246 start_codon:yes stop_codon:yes gene_type:complete